MSRWYPKRRLAEPQDDVAPRDDTKRAIVALEQGQQPSVIVDHKGRPLGHNKQTIGFKVTP